MDDDYLDFAEILEQVFGAEEVPIHLLYRLSDLSPVENSAFLDRWAQEDERRRSVIARHMADLTEENFVVDFAPLFGQMLDDPISEVRLAALDGLWDSSNEALLRPIIDLMQNDKDTRVRASAAANLGHVVLMSEWGQMDVEAGEQVVEALLAVNGDPLTPDNVRRATVESLGGSSDPRVPAIIQAAYYSGNEDMQLGAVFAMGRSADARWLPIIMDEMYNSLYEMRVEAARAAGGVGDSDSVELLIELTQDDELEVRLAALAALGQIGSDRACEVLFRTAEDPFASDEEREAAESSLEEATWLSGEMDFTMMSWDEDADDDLELE